MNTQKKSFQRSLQNLGFSHKETSVYLSLLTIGKGTVSKIARGAEINRTTCYDILDALVAKRLVSISGKEPKQEYIAESPMKVIDYLKKKAAENLDNLKKAESLIPELSSIHNVEGRPKVRFYEGADGLESVYEDTLTSSETICAYAAVDDMHKALPRYFPAYYKRRSKKGIHIKAIVPSTKIGMERHKYDSKESREIAFVDQDLFKFSPEINIYDNKVMIASWTEKLGIIIESHEIADAMKKIFHLSWSEAQRQHKKIISKK